jgi:hypothetical protein
LKSPSLLTDAAGLALSLLALGVVGWSPAPHSTKVAGEFTGRVVQHDTIGFGDTAGHVLALNQAKGSNRSTGPTEYMDSADIVNSEVADLTQGNGTHQGYIVMAKGADSAFTRWSGRVTTRLAPDKTPITTFEGTWTKLRGTGRYTGIKGTGAIQGSHDLSHGVRDPVERGDRGRQAGGQVRREAHYPARTIRHPEGATRPRDLDDGSLGMTLPRKMRDFCVFCVLSAFCVLYLTTGSTIRDGSDSVQ